MKGYKDHLLGSTAMAGSGRPSFGFRKKPPSPGTSARTQIPPSKIHLAGSPLGSNQRGLVVSPPIAYTSAGGFRPGADLDPQELRFALLFWDRLEYPVNSDFNIASSGEVEFLENAGVLSRSRGVGAGGEVGQLILEYQIRTFQELEARDPGKWSLARGEKSLGFRPQEVRPDRGILLELYAAVPVPDKDVPLADILEFKAKRTSELVALRHHLEKLYQGIVAAPDRSLAMTTTIEDLDWALADVLRVSRESGIKLRLSGFDAKLDMDIGQAVVAAVAAYQLGLPLVEALVTGAAVVLPKFSVKMGLGLKKPRPSANPFEYVSRFHRDLF